MPAAAPLDMLRKCRSHFEFVAKRARLRQRRAKAAKDQEAAAAHAAICENFLNDIDATLRDWE